VDVIALAVETQCRPVRMSLYSVMTQVCMLIVMQLRYSFRLYPNGPQRAALAMAFGCARVVFNDALRIRKDAHASGLPYPKAAELSKQVITEAKKTEERAWLGEVSAVVLQQSLRDLEMAYSNFFASLKGIRKGPKIEEPRFKSRKETRQSVRFTANARWSVTPGGDLRLPKIGDLRVKWSRSPAVHAVHGDRDQGQCGPVLLLVHHRD
jgi:putative transposase